MITSRIVNKARANCNCSLQQTTEAVVCAAHHLNTDYGHTVLLWPDRQTAQSDAIDASPVHSHAVFIRTGKNETVNCTCTKQIVGITQKI